MKQTQTQTETAPRGRRPSRWISNRRVATRIFLALAIVSLVAIGSAVVALTQLTAVQGQSEQIYRSNFRDVSALGDLRESFAELQPTLYDVLLADPGPSSAAALEEFRTIATEVVTRLDAYGSAARANLSMASRLDELRAFDLEARAYEKAAQSVVALAQRHDQPMFLGAVERVGLSDLHETADKRLDQLVSFEDAAAKQAVAAGAADAARGRWTVTLFVLAGLLLSAILTFLLTRTVTGPIGRVRRVAAALALGDLTVTAGVTSTRRSR